MRKSSLLAIGVFLLGLSGPAARAENYVCPEKITVTNKAAATDGFENWNDPQAQTTLTTIDLYDGPPSEMGQLKPDNADTKSQFINSMWLLAGSREGFWMSCVYANTNIRLIHKLDGNERLCSIKTDRNAQGTVVSGKLTLVCN